ncbi:MAG: DUF4358 domain-containing protein [Eubacterium sp.]|nr:DUF4358 domain-containing protein [Eubacterium sp.]
MKREHGNRNNHQNSGLGRMKKMVCNLLAFVCFALALVQAPAVAEAKASAKSLCKAALDATGGSSYLTSQTTKAGDCPIFTVAQSKKISSIAYLCDDKEIYSICVVKAAKKSDASGLLKSIKAYQKNNSSSDYLGDYSQTEQNVFKNAVCGKKGQYVWYIAMSSKKDVNKKGQDALKKQL